MPDTDVCVGVRWAKDTAVLYPVPDHLASGGIWDNDFGLILTLKG